MLDQLIIDGRYAVRRLVAMRWGAVLAVSVLALALGASITAYSVLNATALRAVSTADPHALASISVTDVRNNRPGFVYQSTFDAFREAQQSFSHLAMYQTLVLRGEVGRTTLDLASEGVTAGFFELTGIPLRAGRGITELDENAQGPAVAVISTGFRERFFAPDAAVIGEHLLVEGKPVTIVGIAAPEFQGLTIDVAIDMWMPLGVARALVSESSGFVRAQSIVARLAPGVRFDQARAEVEARWDGIQAATTTSLPPALHDIAKSQRVALEPLANGFSQVRAQYASSVWVLLGLTAGLLVIACVNLTGLMLTRVLADRHETAVKLALGISRARLFRQVVLESLLLVIVALMVSVPLAWWATIAVTHAISVARAIPLAKPLTPDLGVFAVAALVSTAMAFLISFLPAFAASLGSHRDMGHGSRTVGRPATFARHVVLVTQMAVAVVLLVGASLFAVTVSRLDHNQQAFRGAQVLFTRLWKNPGDRAALPPPYFRTLLGELSSIPGVQSASLSSSFPGYLAFKATLPTEVFSVDAGADSLKTSGLTELVSPGFFDAFGIARLGGRDFSWSDDETAPHVAIISAALASRLFPGRDAVGARLSVPAPNGTASVAIVGVVADTAFGTVRDPVIPMVFRPIAQLPARAQAPMAHVRVAGDLNAMRLEFARGVEQQGRHFTRGLLTLEEWMDFALLQERLLAGTAIAAAIVAMLLASLGTFAAMSYDVKLRVREFALRIVLGAQPARVVRHVLRDGAIVGVVGILLGVAVAAGTSRLIASHLYGVGAMDPRVFAAAAAGIATIVLLAAVGPVRRALRTDPAETLRQ